MVVNLVGRPRVPRRPITWDDIVRVSQPPEGWARWRAAGLLKPAPVYAFRRPTLLLGPTIPVEPCPACSGRAFVRIAGAARCAGCGASAPEATP